MGRVGRRVRSHFGCFMIASLWLMSWGFGQAQTNWPQLGYNNAHLGFNPSEITLSVSNAGSLRELWTFSAQGSLSWMGCCTSDRGTAMRTP